MNINIITTEWRDKINGNTYWSSRVYINNNDFVIIPFQYGYDDHLSDIIDELINRQLLPERIMYINSAKENIHDYCKRLNITIYNQILKVKKKDMFK